MGRLRQWPVLWRHGARILVALQLLAGVALSAMVYRSALEEEREEHQAALAVRAAAAAHEVDVALRGARAAVTALAAFIADNADAPAERTASFAIALARTLPELEALGVAEPGPQGHALRLLAASPAALALEGLDLAAGADHTATLALADATREPALTSRVPLGTEPDAPAVVLMARAVDRAAPGAVRRHAIAVIRPDSLVGKAEYEGGHRMALLDRSALPGLRWLAGADPGGEAEPEAHHDILVGSRIWSVIPVSDAAPPGPARSTLLLALGLLATASVAGLTALVYRWRARVAVEAGWRTRDLQLALRQLEASQQRFEDFLAAASDWYWETDAQYRFTFRSAGAQSGDHLDDLIGLDRLTDDDPEMEIAPRRAMLDRHRAFSRMRCIVTTEEGQESISFTGRPVFAADGTFLGYRGSARNVTAAAKAEAAERMARVAAEAATRAKSNFLANMSHEIRTPMNGMIGMAQILRHSGLDPSQRRSVDLILRSANSLLAVLNDILDYSKLEVGSIQLEAVPCQVGDIMEEVASLVRQTAEEKGVALHCILPSVPPPAVMGDPVRLRQVLMNLASNAVKFTSQGSVRLMLTCQAPVPAPAGGPPRMELQMAVADTGIGMDQQTIARLFTRFMQADPSSTRRFGGTGLGLSIAQELARIMGGQVTVESRLGQGSTFTLILSLALAPTLAEAAPEPEEPLAGPEEEVTLRILAAEDDEINRLVLSGFLIPYGHALTLVADGAEAVEAARTGSYDIVLMDVMMPNLDGVQATRAIRALPPPHCEVPIIALTANALAGHREEYLKAGMDDYVSKPISRVALYRAIERRIGARAFARVREALPAAPPPAPAPVEPQAEALQDLADFMASLDTERATGPAQ